MSRLFRGKLLAGLHDLYKAGELKLEAEMGMNYKNVKTHVTFNYLDRKAKKQRTKTLTYVLVVDKGRWSS